MIIVIIGLVWFGSIKEVEIETIMCIRVRKFCFGNSNGLNNNHCFCAGYLLLMMMIVPAQGHPCNSHRSSADVRLYCPSELLLLLLMMLAAIDRSDTLDCSC